MPSTIAPGKATGYPKPTWKKKKKKERERLTREFLTLALFPAGLWYKFLQTSSAGNSDPANE